jgi:hypothetical protein
VAINSWVLFLDDDIMLKEDFLEDFLAQKRATPDRIIALDGRDYQARCSWGLPHPAASNTHLGTVSGLAA